MNGMAEPGHARDGHVVGSTGDVRPMVALGAGLRAAGHEVRLATHAQFRDLIEGQGLEFWPIAGNPIGELSTEAGRGWWPREPTRLPLPVSWATWPGTSPPVSPGLPGCMYRVRRHRRVTARNRPGLAGRGEAGHPRDSRLPQPRTPTSYYPTCSFQSCSPGRTAPRRDPAPRSARTIASPTEPFGGSSGDPCGNRSTSAGTHSAPPLSQGDHFGGALDAPRVLYGYSPIVAPRPRTGVLTLW